MISSLSAYTPNPYFFWDASRNYFRAVLSTHYPEEDYKHFQKVLYLHLQEHLPIYFDLSIALITDHTARQSIELLTLLEDFQASSQPTIRCFYQDINTYEYFDELQEDMNDLNFSILPI